MPRSKLKNTPQANYCYRQARQAINRLSSTSRREQTQLTILKHLKAAIAADGGHHGR